MSEVETTYTEYKMFITLYKLETHAVACIHLQLALTDLNVLPHIIQLIICKHFNICCFIAVAYKTIDRLRTVIIMRPSSLGGGRILRRTLSVCLSVCLSVRPSRYRYRASRRAT